MSAICPKPLRRPPLPRRPRAFAALIAVAFAGALGGPAAAQAAPGPVELTGVFAAPVKAKPYASAEENERILCTPEPAGRLEYGTQAPFDRTTFSDVPSAIGSGYPGGPGYIPANMPSSADLVPDTTAGASTDLCFGFTLTPNMQPDFILDAGNSGGKRLQAATPLPDVDATHVAVEADKTPIDNDDLKTAVIDLPEGFAGNIGAAATCTNAEFGLGAFEASTCDPASQVGTAFVRVSTILGGTLKNHLALGGAAVPETTDGFDGGQVYNLEHGPDELGRLGVSVTAVLGVAPAKFIVRLVLTPEGRVRSIAENAPRQLWRNSDLTGTPRAPKPGAKAAPLYVESVGVRAWGSKADHPTLAEDFAEWGTDCSRPLSASASAETYLGTKSQKSSTGVSLTGCETLPFQPSVSVTTAERRPGVPTAATVRLALGQTTSGLKTALLKDAAVTLPSGLELGAQVASGANGLPLCSPEQFGQGSTTPSACPEGSRAAKVKIVSPLVKLPFEGYAYLGAQSAVGELPSLLIDVAPTGATAVDAPRIKLTGSVDADADGRLTTTFLDAPQLRFSELALDFPGGENALFVTPRSCGSTTGISRLTTYARPGAPYEIESAPLVIDEDCAAAPFAPSLAMSSTYSRAGAKATTTVTIERPDRSPWLKDVKVTLPSGFIADLNAASECSAGDAYAAMCPESSRIGTVTTLAGVGPKPLALQGQMFLSERAEGAVAGAVILVRAKIGDIDLGNVVVPARIDLRPTDAGLTLSTSAPLRFKGLALNLRSIAVALDRSNFALNPTACGPLRASLDATADGGQTGSAGTEVSYWGCGDLPFQPGFAVKLSGDTGPKGHPQLDVTLTPRAGDSNLRSTTVMMPAGVATDLNNLKNKCTEAQFASGGCPAASRVGSVHANVSITPETIAGDVNLVDVPGSTLPGLGLSFKGRYTMRIASRVRIDGSSGRIIAEFPAIPDVPVTKLDMRVDGGAKGPIQIAPSACKADTSWDASFGGHGGKTSTTKIAVPCALPVKPSLKWSRTKGITFSVAAPKGKTLKSAKLTVPKGFKLKTGKTGRRYAKVKVTGGSKKVKIRRSKASISVTASSKAPTKLSFSVKTKGYTLPKSYKNKLKKGKKVRLKVRVVLNDGKVTNKTLTLKVS